MALAGRSSASLVDFDDAEKRRALEYLRAAENAAGVVDGAEPDSVQCATVVGAGTMGTGIAMVLAEAGIPVCITDTNSNALQASLRRISSTYERAVTSGKLTKDGLSARLGNTSIAVDERGFADADLVIEAIVEEMDAKTSLFGRLDSMVKDSAILATNTSALDVNVIAAATRHPGRVVGMHFFSPANKMRLLEVVRGRATSPPILAAVTRLARRLGKVPVISEVCDGFIGNRMFEQYFRQALFLLEEGAHPWEIDRALENWGMAMGPFRVMDVIGGDVPYAVRRRRYRERPDINYSRIADEICEKGWLGEKSGRGWYNYSSGSDRAPNTDVEPIVSEYSRRHGIPRRRIDSSEIVERSIFALVNEGAAILNDGTAQRASDIDVVFTAGFGFPKARGGPMYFADRLGLGYVVARLDEFRSTAVTDREFWTPAPLLAGLAARGRGLTQEMVASGTSAVRHTDGQVPASD